MANAILSALLPGLGQFCQGRFLMGSWFLFGFVVNLLLTLAVIGLITTPVWVFWSIVDAGLEDKRQRELSDWRIQEALRGRR